MFFGYTRFFIVYFNIFSLNHYTFIKIIIVLVKKITMKKISFNQKTDLSSQLLTEKNDSSSFFSEKKVKLTKLKYLLENSQNFHSFYHEKSSLFFGEKKIEVAKDLPLFLSLIEKPLNLLFSIDQFVFEFSKTTYQQKKTGDFFQQLKERKKFSLFYGHLTRKQIVNLFKKAQNFKGYFSRNLFSLLERRLDIVVYRTGLTRTIAEARQLIKHNKILVNNTKVNVSSYLLHPGDVISIKSEILSGFLRQITDGLTGDTPKQYSKIFDEYYSNLKKNFDESPLQGKNFSSKKNIHGKLKKRVNNSFLTKSEKNFQSKQICSLLLEFLLTRLKSRCFFSVYFPLIPQSLSSKDNKVLIQLKWKSSSTLKQNKKKIQYQKKSFKNYNNGVETLYATGGCLQKKPQFWKQDFSYQEKRKLFFSKNSKFFKEFHPLKSKNRLLLKTSFLLFFKHLDIYKKFTGLAFLNFRKSFSKKLAHQNKSRFSKILHWRIIKPIHLETSYKLLSSIFLYTPQRINFPFSLDLDLIKRSLR